MKTRRIPLAWNNLTHSLPRLAVAVCGIGFAVILIFMQTGFRNALFDSTVKIVYDLDVDIVVVSRARFMLSTTPRFREERLYQAKQVEGVEVAQPLYLETSLGTLRSPGHPSRPIRVLGFDLSRPVFCDEAMNQSLALIRSPNTALIDRKSKQSFAIDMTKIDGGQPQMAELAGKQVALVGAFNMGTDFANEGNVIMSLENFCDYFPLRSTSQSTRQQVDVGLIRCRDGVSPEQVRENLVAALPQDVTIMTRSEFIRREVTFWGKSTPIGVIFGLGTIMGFAVGVMICYQIIYSDINDQMPEFATLKAMGYDIRYFVSLVLAESFYLSVFGFLPGMFVSLFLYNMVTWQTGLPMWMTVPRASFVFLLTVVMCTLSGFAALRKLMSTDPASLF